MVLRTEKCESLKGGHLMSKEKQILLLYAEGYSQRTIAARLKASRNTVASVIAAAKRAGLQASQIVGM